ncbi:hypothetical protein CU669_20955, partial [Paramagnetospirillum kuznetsovii]
MNSSVTGLADGSFVVVWNAIGQDGSSFEVYGQHFNANGTKAGGEFHINSYSTSDQYMPTVTGLADGSFVASWMSYGQDGNKWSVAGQHYQADGAKIGGEFLLNDVASGGDQMYPSIIGLTNGNLALGFTASGNSMDIRVQVLDAADMLNGDASVANSVNSSVDASSTSLAALSDGSFVATWASIYQDGSGWGVYGQHYDASGSKTGGEFRINTTTVS